MEVNFASSDLPNVFHLVVKQKNSIAMSGSCSMNGRETANAICVGV